MANVFYLFHVKEVPNKKNTNQTKPICGSSQRDSVIYPLKVQVKLFSLNKGANSTFTVFELIYHSTTCICWWLEPRNVLFDN